MDSQYFASIHAGCDRGGAESFLFGGCPRISRFKDLDLANPLLLHLAFVSDEPEADRGRLEKVGASFEDEVRLKDGSHLVMMRDPWGLRIQLCKRGQPMIKA